MKNVGHWSDKIASFQLASLTPTGITQEVERGTSQVLGL